MSVGRGTDGLLHPPDGGLHDHHAAPDMVIVNSQSVISIPPSSTANLDIILPRSDYRQVRVQVHGPKAAVYTSPSLNGYEGSAFTATTVALEAISHGWRGVGGGSQYTGDYSKLQGATNLSDYVFDNNVSLSAKYIAIQSAQIIGAILRFVMVSKFGGSSWVWIVGKVTLL